MTDSSEDYVACLVRQLLNGNRWNKQQANDFFSALVSGVVDEIHLSAALASLRTREVRDFELVGAAEALLNASLPFPKLEYSVADIVGTGGDGKNTINVSTVVSLTIAALGYKIVKHGNRSVSSVSGSFDLLERLGIETRLNPDESKRLVDQLNICFLFAPMYHSGIRHAANVRRKLGVRTIINLVGPLVNPTRPNHILLGVAEQGLLDIMASAISNLGCQSAVIVHGSGIDEVAVHGPTKIVRLGPNGRETMVLNPIDFGSPTFDLDQIVCDDPVQNQNRSIAILDGNGTQAENSVIAVNASVAMTLFGKEELSDNYQEAYEMIGSGNVMKHVRSLVKVGRQEQ